MKEGRQKFSEREAGDRGQAALERLGFGESTVSKSLAGLGRIMLFNYLFTYAVLKDKKPSFQQIE